MIGIRELDAASGAQVRLSNARSELDTLLAMQLAEETALRGYVATRDAYFLEPDGPPNPQFDRQAERLENLLERERIPGAIDAVHRMRDLHRTWENEVALPLRNEPTSRQAYVQQANGKVLTDEMRGESQTLRAALTLQSNAVEETLRNEINTTVGVSVGLVTVFAIIAFGYAVSRSQALTRLVREQSLVDALQRTLRVSGERLPRTSMGSAYTSATREALVGGDLLDAWRAGPDRGWFLIADASGKGIQAARHSAFAQYAIRALAAESGDPADIVRRFNRLFISTFDDPSVFVVLFLGAFDARTQTLRYASAGHGTAYVRRGTLVERLPPTGSIIGLDVDQKYETESVPLALGDIVLLATDGLTEARDQHGELLGEDRVASLFAEGPSDPQALCDRLVEVANAFSGGVQDDLAIIALRVTHEEGEGAATAFSPIGERSAS
ncbi:MAG TPA: SpoIIE family protein phosphatase [Candidatus Limnocylindria bacterium]|nr:SpoIIE family protein phosphatase [Candidatus Limnocylindria bacterium]